MATNGTSAFHEIERKPLRAAHVDINIDHAASASQVYTDQWTTSSASRCPAAEQ